MKPKKEVNTVEDRAIGERIQRLREKKGLTQQELSKKIDLNNSVLSRIEAGKRPVRADELKRIAGALEVPEGILMGSPVVKEKSASYDLTPEKNKYIIERILAKFPQIDLTVPGAEEKLEAIIKLVLDDHHNKK